jgi:hypothetical protein
MNILTERFETEKGILRSVTWFFKSFSVSRALKRGNAYKSKGVSVVSILKYLMQLVFTQRSMYMDFLTNDSATPAFRRDAAYRLLRLPYINWAVIVLSVAERIICGALERLTSTERICAIVVDDTFYGRNRSKKVELLAKTFDHAGKGQKFKRGFRLLSLAWTDGVSLIPLLFRHMSSEKQKNRYREIDPLIDKRSCGYKARMQAISTMPKVLLEMLAMIAKSGIKAKHVIFDSWFSYPATIMAIRKIGLHVVGRLKNTKTILYSVDGKTQTLAQIYASNKKRRGKSKYLLSVNVRIHNPNKETLDVKIVFVRDRSNRKKWIAFLSTDVNLDEEAIIQLYGKRWDIEVFFKVCKSYLRLGSEFQQLSYDAITAHTAIVFLRYMLLAIEERNEKDNRTMGELFFHCCDEMPDMHFSQVLGMMLEMLRATLNDIFFLSDAQINAIMDSFIAKTPVHLRILMCPNDSLLATS